jgi:hypothetical protein
MKVSHRRNSTQFTIWRTILSVARLTTPSRRFLSCRLWINCGRNSPLNQLFVTGCLVVTCQSCKTISFS